MNIQTHYDISVSQSFRATLALYNETTGMGALEIFHLDTLVASFFEAASEYGFDLRDIVDALHGIAVEHTERSDE